MRTHGQRCRRGVGRVRSAVRAVPENRARGVGRCVCRREGRGAAAIAVGEARKGLRRAPQRPPNGGHARVPDVSAPYGPCRPPAPDSQASPPRPWRSRIGDAGAAAPPAPGARPMVRRRQPGLLGDATGSPRRCTAIHRPSPYVEHPAHGRRRPAGPKRPVAVQPQGSPEPASYLPAAWNNVNRNPAAGAMFPARGCRSSSVCGARRGHAGGREAAMEGA
jgi:hypothetical protein